MYIQEVYTRERYIHSEGVYPEKYTMWKRNTTVVYTKNGPSHQTWFEPRLVVWTTLGVHRG